MFAMKVALPFAREMAVIKFVSGVFSFFALSKGLQRCIDPAPSPF